MRMYVLGYGGSSKGDDALVRGISIWLYLGCVLSILFGGCWRCGCRGPVQSSRVVE